MTSNERKRNRERKGGGSPHIRGTRKCLIVTLGRTFSMLHHALLSLFCGAQSVVSSSVPARVIYICARACCEMRKTEGRHSFDYREWKGGGFVIGSSSLMGTEPCAPTLEKLLFNKNKHVLYIQNEKTMTFKVYRLKIEILSSAVPAWQRLKETTTNFMG